LDPYCPPPINAFATNLLIVLTFQNGQQYETFSLIDERNLSDILDMKQERLGQAGNYSHKVFLLANEQR